MICRRHLPVWMTSGMFVARRDVLQREAPLRVGQRHRDRLAGDVGVALVAGRARRDRRRRRVGNVDQDVVERVVAGGIVDDAGQRRRRRRWAVVLHDLALQAAAGAAHPRAGVVRRAGDAARAGGRAVERLAAAVADRAAVLAAAHRRAGDRHAVRIAAHVGRCRRRRRSAAPRSRSRSSCRSRRRSGRSTCRRRPGCRNRPACSSRARRRRPRCRCCRRGRRRSPAPRRSRCRPCRSTGAARAGARAACAAGPSTQMPPVQVWPAPGHAPQSFDLWQPSPITPQYWPPVGVHDTGVHGRRPPSGCRCRPSASRRRSPAHPRPPERRFHRRRCRRDPGLR